MMMRLDQRLEESAATVRDKVNQVPLRPVATLRRRMWLRRGATAAVSLAAVAGVIVGSVVQLDRPATENLFGGPASDPVASQSPTLPPVMLRADFIWPEPARSGAPVEVALGFATEVLGWSYATATADPDAGPVSGPVWVQLLSDEAVEPVDVLTVPVGGDQRVLAQIGTGITAGRLEPESLGYRVSLPTVASAEAAEVTIRLNGGQHLVVVADAQDLAVGWVPVSEVDDPAAVESVLVRYVDANHRVVAATGGDFWPGEPPESEANQSAGAMPGEDPAEAEDPNIQPIEYDGPKHKVVADAIDSVPALASLTGDGVDVDLGTGSAAIVELLAEDGSRVEVIVQRRPVPLEPSTVGSPQVVTVTEGPGGEEVFLKDNAPGGYQVIVVDQDLLVVNIIVERFAAPPQSRELGALAAYTLDDITEWALQILDHVQTFSGSDSLFAPDL